MGCLQLTYQKNNFLNIAYRKNGQLQKKNALDYFSGGMAMPNRNVQGNYRYNYQGQELDKETGKVAFELRLYDPRINRWLTTDPKGEFASPYLAMGNNWINKIDPDGGSTVDPPTEGTFTNGQVWNDADGSWTYNSNDNVWTDNNGGGNDIFGSGFSLSEVFISNATWDKVTNNRIKTLDLRLRQPATKFINQVEQELDIKLRMTQARRTFAQQDDLYAQGRTKPGNIVTNARGGDSNHNYGLAFDVVIMDDSKKPNWTPLSPEAAQIGVDLGFEWGGNWRRFKDYPHFQMVFGQTIKQLQSVHNAGKK